MYKKYCLKLQKLNLSFCVVFVNYPENSYYFNYSDKAIQ